MTTPPRRVEIGYRSAQAPGVIRWVTVASFRLAGPLHAATRLLGRQNILSRIDPVSGDMEEMPLQTPESQAGRAREILGHGMPELAGIAKPTGGFPVVARGGGPNVPYARRALPLTLPPKPTQAAGTRGGGYYVALTVIWILLILVVLSMMWAFFALADPV